MLRGFSSCIQPRVPWRLGSWGSPGVEGLTRLLALGPPWAAGGSGSLVSCSVFLSTSFQFPGLCPLQALPGFLATGLPQSRGQRPRMTDPPGWALCHLLQAPVG